MLVVELVVRGSSEGEQGKGTITIEKQVGDSWRKEKEWVVDIGGVKDERKILLEPGQRVVVEGAASQILVYDKEQMAAVPAESVNPKPEPKISPKEPEPFVRAPVETKMVEPVHRAPSPLPS